MFICFLAYYVLFFLELIIGVFDYFIYGQFTGDFIQATIASIIVSVIAMVIHLIFGMKEVNYYLVTKQGRASYNLSFMSVRKLKVHVLTLASKPLSKDEKK